MLTVLMQSVTSFLQDLFKIYRHYMSRYLRPFPVRDANRLCRGNGNKINGDWPDYPDDLVFICPADCPSFLDAGFFIADVCIFQPAWFIIAFVRAILNSLIWCRTYHYPAGVFGGKFLFYHYAAALLADRNLFNPVVYLISGFRWAFLIHQTWRSATALSQYCCSACYLLPSSGLFLRQATG